MGTRIMQVPRRAAKDDIKQWMSEEEISESEPEPRPKAKSKSKITSTPASTSKQKAKSSATPPSTRKGLVAVRKQLGHREEPLISLNDTPDIDQDVHSGPSTSPSLAGTRSKRSLKVPARFSDPEFAFRDSVEPARVSASREAKEAAGKASAEPTDDDDDDDESSLTVTDSDMTTISESNLYRFRRASTTPNSTPGPSTPSKTSQESPVAQKSKIVSPSTKRSSREKRGENEDTSNEPLAKIFKATSRPPVTLKKQSVSPPNENSVAASASPTRPPLEQVCDSVQASEPSVKLEPASSGSQNVRQVSPSKKKKKKSSSKLRTRSLEKVCNNKVTNNIGAFTDSVGATISNPVINMTIQPAQQNHKPQLQQLLQQPLPHIQQIHQLSHPPPKQIHIPPYGSRLLPMDQPILLPVSVAPIGPITTNLAAVNGALRKPPFVSPILEMSLKHDKAIRQRIALENLPSMIRIASHLGIKDRINLRQVSKLWRSVIDSDAVWKKTLLTPEDICLDANFLLHHLNKFRTLELQFEVAPSEIPENLIQALVSQPITLKRIYLNSTDSVQNTAVHNILKVFDGHLKYSHVKAMPFRLSNQNLLIQQGEIHWKPRVTVDGLGYLLVEMSSTCDNDSKVEHQDECFIGEELDELTAKFDWKSIYKCEQLISLKIDCVSLS